ncbi:hypothetical protein O181_100701 [Austropuccinia psidii MF-1]|uniref:Uncharacterized protein n=1 Tax=Austropuccinia psidii MF-1 TaxID=1389203 RepID=A0A9Q3JFT6_9BASI|nr:hypothetical protein [Austropuccinia psidii MF-1]
MIDSFLGPLTINRLIGKNSVKVRLTEEFSRKHSAFPVSLVQPYHQTGDDMFPSKSKSRTPKEIVEVEDSPVLVNKIIKDGNIGPNGNIYRQYLVRFKSKTADKDKVLTEDAIPDCDLHLRIFRASRRAEQSHQL